MLSGSTQHRAEAGSMLIFGDLEVALGLREADGDRARVDVEQVALPGRDLFLAGPKFRRPDGVARNESTPCGAWQRFGASKMLRGDRLLVPHPRQHHHSGVHRNRHLSPT